MPKDRRLRDDIDDSVAAEMLGGMSKVPPKAPQATPTMSQTDFTTNANVKVQSPEEQMRKAGMLREMMRRRAQPE